MYERLEFLKGIPRLQTNSSIKNARMAELVDASVSNTDAARRAGSIPAPGTKSFLSLRKDFFFNIQGNKFKKGKVT